MIRLWIELGLKIIDKVDIPGHVITNERLRVSNYHIKVSRLFVGETMVDVVQQKAVINSDVSDCKPSMYTSDILYISNSTRLTFSLDIISSKTTS